MNIFLLIGLAKANDYLNTSWSLAGLYTVILLFERLMPSLESKNYPLIFISIAISFVVAGYFFTLLYSFQDSIFSWLLILMIGLGILTYLSP
jgi:hypothetical protein